MPSISTRKLREAADAIGNPQALRIFDSCCEWLAQNFKGIQASMERIEPDGSHVVEFRNRPLLSIQPHVGANNVRGIRFTFAANSHPRVFEMTGIKAIHLEQDAAGFPKFLELTNADEKVMFRFTGSAQPWPTYSGNSWGE